VVRARFAAGAELTIGGMLLGRDRERHTIDAVLNEARRGTSATIALVGEPGIGKTALLDDAARRATGMRLLRARGMQSEAQIPFASLLELIRPALGALAQIPGPQAAALERALALRPGAAEERFAIGAATLSLPPPTPSRGRCSFSSTTRSGWTPPVPRLSCSLSAVSSRTRLPC
jgi:hypothetical protein